ncbi:purine and uridine phosphorylase [Purpureocillium lavendulum]|uniref:Purine and uridine phosphorylase n=1 Tax=Purpureocillium lavendulum TaxID=1247861 RepID=A0AB34FGB4_9HYPO|nr:purine and uridine phosphorylase [Purpureocillium lavendulum]
MPNPNDYTVGWICAISTEYIAAQEFLDEEHEAPDFVSPNDSNDYTLGTIGKHNVVIAVLPDGEYGTASAASVATNLLHSFPNVRIGLMVGIGGGAPSEKHDIRLGDVVVSAPRAREGGVFQYDFGKTIQDQAFQHTRVLNQPPTTLRTATAGLQSQYKRKGHKLGESVTDILDRNARLRQEFERPPSSADRLFKANITHDPAGCAAICAQDPSNLVQRRERTEHEDNPAIHHGLIASANQLMKDASVRDMLAREKDVLCFEMEAAGLMNCFPCLVIRGICDYSDSHKTKEWQGYAAMVAAAYTKDLLSRIPPNKVEVEKRISEVLPDLLGTTSQIDTNVKMIRYQLEGHGEREILKWLTEIDYAPQHCDYLRKRQEGTGRWLLESPEYQDWLKANRQTLFCPGIPGAGKTILTSIVVEDLAAQFQNDLSVGIAFIYFSFKDQEQDKQKLEELLASLLKQLCQCRSSLPEAVVSLYAKHKDRRTPPSSDEISTSLQSVAALYSRVFIAIDAMDECRATGECRSKFLSEIFSLLSRSQANLFVTSRPIPDIQMKFQGCLSREIIASEEDVRRYIDGHMSLLPAFVLNAPKLQEQIKTELSRAAGGMFLLAELYLRSLEDKISAREMKNALKQFRKQCQEQDRDQKLRVLSAAYKGAMERIKGQMPGFRQLAEKHALAVEIGKSELDEDNIPEVELSVSVCCGLVTVDEESEIIRLVHYTAQEYFEQTQKDWFPNAEADLANISVTYLSFSAFETGICHTDQEFEERLCLNPLYNYAANNWGYHAHAALMDDDDLVLSLLESNMRLFSACQAMLASPKNRVVNLLLDNGATVDSKDNCDRTPSSWAAENGYDNIVRLLLEKSKGRFEAY